MVPRVRKKQTRIASRRHRKNEQREDLPRQITKERGEGDEVDVDGQKDQFDRHQKDDDVLAVQEQPEDPDHEERRRHRQIMFKADHWRAFQNTTGPVPQQRADRKEWS